MVPLAIGFGGGSDMMRPLAIAVVGRLSVSTLLTLFVVPCAYVIFTGASERAVGWLTGSGPDNDGDRPAVRPRARQRELVEVGAGE
jgi:hypothetical protein